jgi:hypothetical protein
MSSSPSPIIHQVLQQQKQHQDNDIMLPLHRIMSMLLTKERRSNCARVCRYWSTIVSHHYSNIHVIYIANVLNSLSFTSEIIKNNIIPFQFVQTIRLIDCPRNIFLTPLGPSSTSSWLSPSSWFSSNRPTKLMSQMVSMPMLTTLSLTGCLIDWHELHHLFTIAAPRLQHVTVDVEFDMKCHHVLDLFRRTRTSHEITKSGSTGIAATINGNEVNKLRCGRCQQLSGVLMTCDKPGRSCQVHNTLFSSSNQQWCIPCLFITNHRWCQHRPDNSHGKGQLSHPTMVPHLLANVL